MENNTNTPSDRNLVDSSVSLFNKINTNTEESSLTSPSDRNLVDKYIIDPSVPPLNKIDGKNASEFINDRSHLINFPKVERTYLDPPVQLQNIGLLSFIPSSGATPDKDGFYGFAKIRGCFNTEDEANIRAEYIIRNFDSFHRIFHVRVGQPFPITTESKYSADHQELKMHIKKKIHEEFTKDLDAKREQDKKEFKELTDKEKNFKEKVRIDSEDPIEIYTTLKTKLAQVSWVWLETKKKLDTMQDSIVESRKQIADLDVEYPDFKNKYYEKYCEARRDAGLSIAENVEEDDSFMKFLIMDAPLPF